MGPKAQGPQLRRWVVRGGEGVARGCRLRGRWARCGRVARAAALPARTCNSNGVSTSLQGSFNWLDAAFIHACAGLFIQVDDWDKIDPDAILPDKKAPEPEPPKPAPAAPAKAPAAETKAPAAVRRGRAWARRDGVGRTQCL
jgi:hypothetical protein